MKKIGLIVNPVAGLGGRVGLKGSDGEDIRREALSRGAMPEAPDRARQTLNVLRHLSGTGISVQTCPGDMGETAAGSSGLPVELIASHSPARTTGLDTIKAARRLADLGVDLILFAGGDGTARDIHQAVGDGLPVLGIPAGVKIHSAVYAVNPGSAGEAAAAYLTGQITGLRLAEVMDIDEEEFRQGRVGARLYGYLSVPDDRRRIQGVKAGGFRSDRSALQGMAREVIDGMDRDTLYIIGPGTTTRAVMDELGLPNTLIGVDVVRDGQLLENDVTEKQLIDLIAGHPGRIVVTPIGGQGHIFGRGNQQISPGVLRRVGTDNIIIVAMKAKLASLRGRPLLLDTGDAALDRELAGYRRIITGRGDFVIYKAGDDSGRQTGNEQTGPAEHSVSSQKPMVA